MEMPELQKYVDEMVRCRRHLHKRPEEGWTEFETTAFIVEQLRSFGCAVRVGPELFDQSLAMGRSEKLIEEAQIRAQTQGVSEALLSEMDGWTGCVAEIDTGRPGPVTAFRVDIDCVCVEETSDKAHEANAGGYASERIGLMHACGHDGHSAVGLALAHWCTDHRDELCGKIRIFFQPAEEGTRGGLPLAKGGLLEDVDYLICSHIGTGCRLGEIGICEKGFFATTKFDIRFKGVPAHAGTAPQKGRSALLAAAATATALAGIPRSGEGDTRISIGRLVAGEGRNVVPVNAYLQIETRGATEVVNAFMCESVERIVCGMAKAYGVDYSIEQVGRATNLETDSEVNEALRSIAKGISFIDNVSTRDDITGSEDCTWLCREVRSHGGKAGFYIFGCNEHGHHRGDFCIQDEQSLPEAFEMDRRFVLMKNGLQTTPVV